MDKQQQSNEELINGYVDHIIFRNNDNGYTVMVMICDEEELTCVGVFSDIAEGECIEAKGEYTDHPTYGRQFAVKSFEEKAPQDALAIERYLGSGAIKGIGIALAARIVRRFKEDTFRIIEEEPERLAEVKGISQRKAMEIADQVNEKRDLRQAMIFLQQYGISTTLAVKIYNTYGQEVYSILKENPYRMADDVDGVGFRTADEIASRVGIRTDSDFRIRSGIQYALLQASNEGNTYLPMPELTQRASALLEIEPEYIEKHYMNLAMDRKIIMRQVDDVTQIYASAFFYMEANAATMLKNLDASFDVPDIEIEARLRQIDKQTKMDLDEHQVEAVKEAHAKGQPVLVGTITIEASEQLSGMLRREGIQHKVLNAKFHELEAEIVADAGIHGAVTIATNMAGRGTDIKLDEEAKAAGGLKIIGTERHESRRIDNQLRGRSGRQGDPGESRFYISLEDDLMRLFGSEKMISMFNALGIPEGQEIEHKMLSKAIENAQKKIEGNNFGIRKNLLEYDQVNNEQREIIYKERRRVLDGESMRDTIFKMIADTIDNTVDLCIGENTEQSEWDLTELNEMLLSIMPVKAVTKERVEKISKNELKQQLKEEAVKLYEEKEAEFPEEEQIRELERVVLLKVIDQKWMDHIDDMDQLREGIGLQAYGQRDPKVEYKMAAYDMFNEMLESIQQDTVRLLFHVRVEQKVEREQVAKVTGTNKDESGPRKPVQRAERKIYPNDPCPCGSGKKYKQCCGRKPV